MSDKVATRNQSVLDAAVGIAAERGYRNVTRSDVAAVAGVSVGSVNNAFGTMDALRDAVMAEAVSREIPAIVAQGLADRHPAALAAPDELKNRALANLAA